MQTTAGTMRKLPVKAADGSIDLIEMGAIFYLEAQGGDTRVRTRRKKPCHCVQRLNELARKLPGPAFVRCLRAFVVNLNRVRSLTSRNSRGYDLRLDPSSLWRAAPRQANSCRKTTRHAVISEI